MLRGSENKANFDFLRFIQVSDTTHISSDKLRIETTKMMGTERYTKTWVETIIPSTEMEFELNIIKEINIYLEKLGISKLKKYSYIEEIFNACYYRSKDLLEGDVRYFASKPEIVAFIEKA